MHTQNQLVTSVFWHTCAKTGPFRVPNRVTYLEIQRISQRFEAQSNTLPQCRVPKNLAHAGYRFRRGFDFQNTSLPEMFSRTSAGLKEKSDSVISGSKYIGLMRLVYL